MRRPSVVLLLTLTPACTWVSGQEDVLFTSDPPGAHIWIDGKDTGYSCPTVGYYLRPGRYTVGWYDFIKGEVTTTKKVRVRRRRRTDIRVRSRGRRRRRRR